MVAPLDQPLVSAVVIGRAPQIAALCALVDEVHRGCGAAILLSGEAGVGKTRLVGEVRAHALACGFQMLQGNCFEPDTACPYAPLLDLMRAHFADPAELGPGADALHPLLPDLIPAPIAASPPLDAEQDRRRIFAALAQVFLHLAARQPLLVVIEDLHWSDDTSLEALHLLLRRVVDRPLLLLMTYRGDEVGPTLRHWLAQLDRQRLAREWSLDPLTREDVGEMLRAIFAQPQPVGQEFRDAIYALSQGNPFIVEELLKSLVAAGEIVRSGQAWSRRPLGRLHIPRSVRDAVQQRAARLGGQARHLANVAAVAGRRFDVSILSAVTGYDEGSLFAPIKELMAAQLVVEESAERFAFRHALTREALYDDLLARERQVLHRAVAEAIERRDAGMSESHLGDLAYHFHAAGLWDSAYDYGRRAAERARTLHAPQAVVEQASRALEATVHLDKAPDPALLRLRGNAYDLLGDFPRSRADFETALHLAQATRDQIGEWQALLDLGQLWTGHDYTEAQAQFHRALALARALGEPTALAHSLNRVGNWYANAEQPESSLAYHQEALAIFEQRADLAGRATTLDLLGMASALAGDLVACAHHAAQAITPFRDLGDRQGLIGALLGSTMPAMYETDTLVAAWGPAEASANCAQALALAREIGWRSGEAYALAMVGETLAAQGNYARALDALREGLALAEEIEHPQWAIQTLRGLAGLHTDILALPPAHAEYERALALAREIGSPLWIGDITGALAALLVAQGALADAEAMLGEVLDATTPTRSLGHRQLWCARAELALARGDPALALAILDRLYAAAANLRDEGDIPRLARLKGTALATIGEAERAERLLRGGLRTAEALGLAASRWRLYVALGDLHRQQGRPDDAAHAHMTARRLVAELAAATPEGDLREGFTRAALTLLSPLAARRAAREAHGGLTTREREVAALIARGSTNREIAAALSVGDRTVETHVSNILAKLNCTTRAQIATWATERRLVPPIS